MRHRSGITLVEVLVALFIMGVGLLAILTLFPLGIMTAAQALQDDRVAQITANVSALISARDLRNDAFFSDPTNGAFSFGDTAIYIDPFFAPVKTVTSGQPHLGPIMRYSLPNSTKGNTYTTNWFTPGTSTSSGLTRWFTLNDDYSFTASSSPGGGLARDPTIPGDYPKSAGIYTCCVLLRRPRPADPTFDDMFIVIYKGRSTLAFQQELWYGTGGNVTKSTVTGTPGSNTLIVNVQAGTTPPSVRRSGWILDISKLPKFPVPKPGKGRAPILVYAQFYQVVNTTSAGATQVTFETQVPLKNTVNSIVIMDNVIDVLQRGFSGH